MSAPNPPQPDSDSEDDDYVPPAENANGDDSDSDSDAEEPDAKRARTETLVANTEEEEVKKSARAELWSSFQSSVSTPDPPLPKSAPKKMVKVEKRYLFAGEEVVEVTEVPEDSADAKKWPRWQPVEESATPSSSSATPTSQLATSSASQSAPPPASSSSPSPAPSSSTTTSIPTPQPKKKPGPRKPKTTLASLPSSSSQKAKKLTTLDKSALDWQAHLQAGAGDGIKDELEANRRGGGYLEKVAFLERVEERRGVKLEEGKGGKRRRGPYILALSGRREGVDMMEERIGRAS